MTDGMPTEYVGDKVLIGSFSEAVDANYDGKYFQTPGGELYLVYSKQAAPKPQKRDGVAAIKMGGSDDYFTRCKIDVFTVARQ